jgi:hypothetical protein
MVLRIADIAEQVTGAGGQHHAKTSYYERRTNHNAPRTSAFGPNAKCRSHRAMSEFGGEPENICSHRVFRSLTHSRQPVWCGPSDPHIGPFRRIRIGTHFEASPLFNRRSARRTSNLPAAGALSHGRICRGRDRQGVRRAGASAATRRRAARGQAAQVFDRHRQAAPPEP